MPSTVLVTGGSGYIARWCIRELLSHGYAVRATVRNRESLQKIESSDSLAAADSARITWVMATLDDDAGWHEAVQGCSHVLHIASPFPSHAPRDEQELIRPARDGTLRVLRHAVAAGVERVVLTSSSAAMAYDSTHRPGSAVDESWWTDVTAPQTSAYAKSKTIAERAAWEFMNREGGKTTLVAIAPNTVIGPIIDRRMSYSIQSIQRLLDGSAPALPNFGFSYVDVRDIADLHVRAMMSQEAAGRRILGAGTFLWYAEVARLLCERMGSQARKVPTRTLPDVLVRALALFDRSLRPILPELGVRRVYSPALAESLLGWRARPVADTIEDCAESLLRAGIVAS